MKELYHWWLVEKTRKVAVQLYWNYPEPVLCYRDATVLRCGSARWPCASSARGNKHSSFIRWWSLPLFLLFRPRAERTSGTVRGYLARDLRESLPLLLSRRITVLTLRLLPLWKVDVKTERGHLGPVADHLQRYSPEPKKQIRRHILTTCLHIPELPPARIPIPIPSDIHLPDLSCRLGAAIACRDSATKPRTSVAAPLPIYCTLFPQTWLLQTTTPQAWLARLHMRPHFF